jgi:hypothetical protein
MTPDPPLRRSSRPPRVAGSCGEWPRAGTATVNVAVSGWQTAVSQLLGKRPNDGVRLVGCVGPGLAADRDERVAVGGADTPVVELVEIMGSETREQSGEGTEVVVGVRATRQDVCHVSSMPGRNQERLPC